MKEWLPVIGVVIAQFVLVGLYFAKLRADDERRWHERRLDAYRAMSRAGRDASLVFAQAEQPEDLDDRRFVTAMDAADSCSLDIALLSSETVREKADLLHTQLEMCAIFDFRSEAFPGPEDLLSSRIDFENAVRKSSESNGQSARSASRQTPEESWFGAPWKFCSRLATDRWAGPPRRSSGRNGRASSPMSNDSDSS